MQKQSCLYFVFIRFAGGCIGLLDLFPVWGKGKLTPISSSVSNPNSSFGRVRKKINFHVPAVLLTISSALFLFNPSPIMSKIEWHCLFRRLHAFWVMSTSFCNFSRSLGSVDWAASCSVDSFSAKASFASSSLVILASTSSVVLLE